MSIMRAERKPVKFSCSFVSITIEINDTRYSVDEVPAGEFGSKAFRLTKHSARDNAVYDVIRTHAGLVECDCPDYESRHRGNGFGMCKHGKALVTLGLLPEPRGVLEPIAPLLVAKLPQASPAPVAECCAPAEPEPCAACVTAPAPAEVLDECDQVDDEDAGPAETWGDSWDDEVWNLGPDAPAPRTVDVFAGETAREHLDHSGRLTLAELTDRQATFYRSWGNDAGEMFALALEAVALQIRLTGAATPAELADRLEVLERDVRDQWMDAGRASALEPEMTAAGRPA